ncbi:MAG: TonB-dependent receptor domain-containing protein [Alistipes onderdonkii]
MRISPRDGASAFSLRWPWDTWSVRRNFGRLSRRPSLISNSAVRTVLWATTARRRVSVYMSDLSLSGAGYTTGADGEYTLSDSVYNRFENKKITWETGEKLNVGVDLQFYNRLNVMVDLFQEVRSGIFLERGTVPAFLGTATTKVYGNLGKVRNRGLDLSMDYTHQIGKDFFISAKGTFTFARNRVLEQDGAGLPAVSQSFAGRPFGQFVPAL